MRTRRLHLLERTSAPPGRVDRERCLIRRVKILGFNSSNKRKYLREGIDRRLYEGKPARKNHPGRAKAPRDVDDTFGRFVNVTLEEDGLWGDLNYEPDHPTAQRLVHIAESMPDYPIGFSHNADGDVEEQEDGTEVVHRILEVRSIDLVSDPATTRGLFEEHGTRPMKLKLKTFFEQAKLTDKMRLGIKALYEAGDMDPELDAPMAEPEPPADMAPPEAMPMDAAAMDPNEALTAGLEMPLMALVKGVLDGSIDKLEAIKKFKSIVDFHDKHTNGKGGGGGSESETTTEEKGRDDEGDEEGEEKPVKEECDDMGGKKKPVEEEKDLHKQNATLQSENAKLKGELAARTLCEQMEVRPSTHLVLALAALPGEKERKALLEEVQGAGRIRKQRTQAAGTGQRAPVEVKDGESLARAITQ